MCPEETEEETEEPEEIEKETRKTQETEKGLKTAIPSKNWTSSCHAWKTVAKIFTIAEADTVVVSRENVKTFR